MNSEKQYWTKDAKNMLNNLQLYTVCYPDLKRSLGLVFKTIFSRYPKNGNKFLTFTWTEGKGADPSNKEPRGVYSLSYIALLDPTPLISVMFR